MNSLTLLDSFLSRSLSVSRRGSPPDSPGGNGGGGETSIAAADRATGRSGSSGILRLHTHPTTPSEHSHARTGDVVTGGEKDTATQSDARQSSSHSSTHALPRRNSDYALQTDRNRLKRSDRLAMGFGMTAVDASHAPRERRASVSSDARAVEQPEGSGLTSRKGKGKARQVNGEEVGDNEPNSSQNGQQGVCVDQHGAAGSGMRRSRSTHSTAHTGGSVLTPSWSSSLWGLGSWLDPSLGGTPQRRRKRASSTSSKNWEYPPGDSTESSSRKEKRKKKKRRSKENGEEGLESQGSEQPVSSPNPAQDESDSSETSTGSSVASQEDDMLRKQPSPSRLETSGRLLFANRVFTPFHHPSLTASVPNLPSEVGIVAASSGLGGMEDVETVDFEGGESEPEEHPDGGMSEVTPRGTPSSSIPSTPSGRTKDGALKRSATMNAGEVDKTATSRQRTDRDDYFGPTAVEREKRRHDRDPSQKAETLASGQQEDVEMAEPTLEGANEPPVSEQDREAREASAQLQSKAGSDDLVESKTKTVQDGPPPYGSALPTAPVDEATASPTKDHKVSLARRILQLLRRIILTVCLAPYDAVLIIWDSGRHGSARGVHQIAVGTSKVEEKLEKAEQVRSIQRSGSLTFSDTVGKGRKSSEKVRPPTPKPETQPHDAEAGEDGAKATEAIDEKMQLEEDTPSEVSPTTAQAAEAEARRSRLLPNPHPVDPMLIHEPKARRVTGDLSDETARKHKRNSSLGVSHPSCLQKPTGAESPAPVVGSPSPRSAVIHHTPKILVLDLDETLIHSTSRSPTWTALRAQHSHNEAVRNAVSTGGSLLGLEGLGGLLGLSAVSSKGRSVRPHMVEVVLDGRSVIYHVYKRPWVDYFLRKVAAWYHVVIFTASVQEYADPVIDWLDQGRGLIAGRLFRDACTYRQGSYLKNLSIVDNDLSRVCLVDNSPASYYLNPGEFVVWTILTRGACNILP